MLSRFIVRPSSHLRFLTLISSNPSSPLTNNNDTAATRSSSSSSSSSHPRRLLNPNSRHTLLQTFRHFSSNNNGDDGKDPSISSSWKISPDKDNDSIFGDDLAGINGDDFNEGLKKGGGAVAADGDWKTADGYKPWSFEDEEKVQDLLFDIGEETTKGMIPSVVEEDAVSETTERSIANQQLELEKERLTAQLKGPNRAFGDLIAASGITDVDIDSLILLKNVEHIEGLPPLSVIEDLRLERSEKKSTNSEIERKKQEEVAKARVRQVDEKGRAYGTGRRKCSIARVWIQPGDGNFIINDKQFDVHFPLLDHRADVLRPFSETKSLGQWDIKCTVKGGGVSGQVGAVRLGVSRALQNWEPGYRPYLRSEGFLTRDSRVVERKKPGKAKARKSFQWVKR